MLYLAFEVFTIASIGGGFSKSTLPLILARIFQAVGSGAEAILGAGTVGHFCKVFAMDLLKPLAIGAYLKHCFVLIQAPVTS